MSGGLTTSVIETVGFRNKLRARWRALPESTRLGISTGTVVGLGILLFFVDHSLGYAVLLAGAIYRIEKLPPVPYRLAGMAGLLVLLAVLAAAWSTPWSLVLLLAGTFAVVAIPGRQRSRVLPAAAVLAAVMYPFRRQ